MAHSTRRDEARVSLTTNRLRTEAAMKTKTAIKAGPVSHQIEVYMHVIDNSRR